MKVQRSPQLWRRGLAALGLLLLLAPAWLPQVMLAWLALNHPQEASYSVVMHFGSLGPLTLLGLGCLTSALFASRNQR
ncbi:hypothetical protein [Deinococcus sp. Marseille-Q6407]|uniref:hypothetical protein n=1 Tax=Deinococcus sp. Marseille-Q6407 TaxID=2969223 RepID=UPI0021BED481|nr:hypothetical protein [Deinococcus sp. Marseille-Q6407]